MRQRDNGFYKYYTQYIQYKSFRNALSRCHTVTRRIDSIVSTLPNYRESIGQSRSGIGVVTGKTAEMEDKCNLDREQRSRVTQDNISIYYEYRQTVIRGQNIFWSNVA